MPKSWRCEDKHILQWAMEGGTSSDRSRRTRKPALTLCSTRTHKRGALKAVCCVTLKPPFISKSFCHYQVILECILGTLIHKCPFGVAPSAAGRGTCWACRRCSKAARYSDGLLFPGGAPWRIQQKNSPLEVGRPSRLAFRQPLGHS